MIQDPSLPPPKTKRFSAQNSKVLLEGSVLKNLLISVSSEDRVKGEEPSDEEAW